MTARTASEVFASCTVTCNPPGMSHLTGPHCRYCGRICNGGWENPNVCRSWWWLHSLGDVELESWEKDECECPCHEVDTHTRDMYRTNNHNPQLTVFPFLQLPGELRNQIYHYHLKQYGHCRISPYYRGTIETALLNTCRQINKEARHIPLLINTLSFTSPFHAYHFLGLRVLPSQKHYVNSVHVDVPNILTFPGILGEFNDFVVPELTRLNLSHLSIRTQGRVEAGWFTVSDCLASILSPIKGLSSFNLVIGSGTMTDATKREILDKIRQILLQDPAAAKDGPERSASVGLPLDDTAIPTQGCTKTALPRSTETSNRQGRTESRTDSMKGTASPDLHAVPGLLIKYNRLKEYAYSFDPEASSVRIRLGRAYEAASEGKNIEFESLANDILGTLEAHFARIVAARNQLPYRLLSPQL